MACSRLGPVLSALALSAGPAFAAIPAALETPSLAQLETVASAGEQSGLVMDGTPSRPSLVVDPGVGLPSQDAPPEETLSSPGSRVKTEVPLPQGLMDKPMTQEYCRGFFHCLGAGISGPVLYPFLGAGIAGGGAAAVGEGIAGKAGKVLGAFFGGLIGLAGGLILAPISLAAGLYWAFRRAAEGKF